MYCTLVPSSGGQPERLVTWVGGSQKMYLFRILLHQGTGTCRVHSDLKQKVPRLVHIMEGEQITDRNDMKKSPVVVAP